MTDRPPTAWALAIAASISASCGSPPPVPTALAGEIHLHQLAGVAHLLADFGTPAVPIAATSTDAIWQIPYSPTARAAGCQLFLLPRCASPCPVPSACVANDRCGASPSLTPLSAGTITITGGALVPRATLSFDAATRSYVASPQGMPIFAGGETLHASAAGAGIPRFTVDLSAPHALVVTAPALTPLHFPSNTELHVAWTADGVAGETVALTAAASTTSGSASGWIECQAPDAQGALDIPAALLSLLPPPPRDLVLVIERGSVAYAFAPDAAHAVRVHAAVEIDASGSE